MFHYKLQKYYKLINFESNELQIYDLSLTATICANASILNNFKYNMINAGILDISNI